MTAEKKKRMIMEMQGLMAEIVDLDKYLSGKDSKQTNLKSPGLPDGIWGGNTDESYKSILAEHNKGKSDPKNMDEALKLLGQIKTSLATAKDKEAAEKTKQQDSSAASQPKPAPAITDDQAKAAFRGLLESIQSGRIKLKAGGDNSVLKQRIGRDWGAIIRVYKGPQGVVDAFYGGLALTDSEKDQLVKINKEGFDGTSTVVGKINQKFLEAINTYIKPFGRALRTEKGMARVIDRRQERQERKQNRANAALKDLWILSKVAQRKEVARERLVKTAERDYEAIDNHDFYYEANLINYSRITENNYGNKKEISKIEFLDFPGKDLFKKIMRDDIEYWVLKYDKENQFRIIRNEYNYKKAVDAFKLMINKKISELEEKKKTNQSNSNSNTGPEKTNTSGGTPNTTKRRPTTDLTTLRGLLTTAGYTPGQGTGWEPLEAPFRAAVEKFANLEGKQLTQPWSWGDVAQQMFGMSPNISGAEQLVSKLIEKQKDAQQAAASGTPATAPAPTAATDGPVDKADVVSGLESLFGQILSKEVKVDQEGADMRRDSKDFRGVIRGLGGAKSAAAYCVEYGDFSLKENKEIIAYKGKTLESLAGKIDRSTVLSKIYTLFTDIRKKSRRPFRRGIREDVLAENVRLWLKGERQEDNTKTSISKSIEIRKAAARKKLGLQS